MGVCGSYLVYDELGTEGKDVGGGTYAVMNKRERERERK
jgi:hypothetical protein